jgi:hypothetical protein
MGGFLPRATAGGSTVLSRPCKFLPEKRRRHGKNGQVVGFTK